MAVSWSGYILYFHYNPPSVWDFIIFMYVKEGCVCGNRAKSGDHVLDLCCGSGDLAFLLSEKVWPAGKVGSVSPFLSRCDLIFADDETLD